MDLCSLVLLVQGNVHKQRHTDYGLLDRVFIALLHIFRELHGVHLAVSATFVLHASPHVSDRSVAHWLVRCLWIPDVERDTKALTPGATTTSTLHTSSTKTSFRTNAIDAGTLLVEEIVFGHKEAAIANVLRRTQQFAICAPGLEIRQATTTW